MAHPNPFSLQHHRSGLDKDLVEQFLSTFGNRQTRRNYRTDLRQFFGGEGVTRQEVSRIQEENISDFLRERADPLKPTTLKRKLETIRSFFRWLAGQNMLEKLPIRKELGTGNLVDRVLRGAREASDEEKPEERPEERASRRTEGSARKSSSGSGRAAVQKTAHQSAQEESAQEESAQEESAQEESAQGETRSGNGPNSPGEADSKRKESSSLRGATDQNASHRSEPGPSGTSSSGEQAPMEEPLSIEKPLSRRFSDSGSTPSDAAFSKKNQSHEGQSHEGQSEEGQSEEGQSKEGQSEEDANEESTGEDADEQDQPTPPQWTLVSGEGTNVDLQGGERVALTGLPDALQGALRKLEEGGVEGFFLRCTSDLKVQIRFHRDEDSSLIKVTIEHRSLRRILRNEEDLSTEPALRQAILYLAGRGWALPTTAYDCVDALPDRADAGGAFSKKHPTWSQESADNSLAQASVATEITAALAKGFGIEKDEEVFVGI